MFAVQTPHAERAFRRLLRNAYMVLTLVRGTRGEQVDAQTAKADKARSRDTRKDRRGSAVVGRAAVSRVFEAERTIPKAALRFSTLVTMTLSSN
jgi:hypothetical protein